MRTTCTPILSGTAVVSLSGLSSDEGDCLPLELFAGCSCGGFSSSQISTSSLKMYQK